MLLNGVELEFDFYDADQMEVFEEAVNRATEEIQVAVNKKGKQSQMIRGVCKATISMLDEIFGEGTAKDVFQGETNFKKCLDVFMALVQERTKQEKEINEQLEEAKLLTEQYGPQQPNRATRRATRKN